MKTAAADEIGDYEVNETGVYFYIGNIEDFIKITCEIGSDKKSRFMAFSVPLTDRNMHDATNPQDISDKDYQGYHNYPAQRFAIYLSVSSKKTKKNHPIDDEYVLSLEKLIYAADMNADEPFVWSSFFHSSVSEFPGLASMLTSDRDIVLRVNSWSKTIAEFPLPKSGKKSAFMNYSSPCWKAKRN